jgi:hypothetical protein
MQAILNAGLMPFNRVGSSKLPDTRIGSTEDSALHENNCKW